MNNPNQKRFSCSACPYESGTRDMVKRHIESKTLHKNVTPCIIDTPTTTCNYCHASVKTMTAINHMEKHLKICSMKNKIIHANAYNMPSTNHLEYVSKLVNDNPEIFEETDSDIQIIKEAILNMQLKGIKENLQDIKKKKEVFIIKNEPAKNNDENKDIIQINTIDINLAEETSIKDNIEEQVEQYIESALIEEKIEIMPENIQNMEESIATVENPIYIGVQHIKNSWKCSISFNYNKVCYNFKTVEHAAYWYDYLALKYYGKNANINGIQRPIDFTNPIEKLFLPPWIKHINNKYKTKLKFNKKLYFVGDYDTLEEALKEQDIKYNELHKIYIETPIHIQRNSDGVAILKNKNQEILVEDGDYKDLLLYTWHICTNGYVLGYVRGKVTTIHRYIMRNGIKDNIGKVVDHIYGNTLDNRKSNLRFATYSENNQNKNRILRDIK